MNRRAAWALAPVLGVGLWWAVHRRGEAREPSELDDMVPTATERRVAPRTTASAPREGAPSKPGGKLTDRTGGNDPSLGKQLNNEFMPLAAKCIDQAKARRPGLKGTLASSMVLAPTKGGKAIVSSIKATAANQIDDPELFECLRESSFSLDGLKAPHGFDLTMPIE